MNLAWIESHQALKDHPKTAAMCEHLGAGRPQVIGHLHLLWWWCIDYAPDGVLSRFEASQIAKAAEWIGDSSLFMAALVKSGFIERLGKTLRIHDWHEYCGALMERRLKRLAAKRPPMAAKRPPTNQPTVPTNQPTNVLKRPKTFKKPTLPEIEAYAKTIGFKIDAAKFFDYYESKGWKIGNAPMKSWEAAVRTWKSRAAEFSNGQQSPRLDLRQVWVIERDTGRVAQTFKDLPASEANAKMQNLLDEIDTDKFKVEVR